MVVSDPDAIVLLTVGSFLLTAELFAYSCVREHFCLKYELLYLQFELYGLQFELLLLQWESVPKKPSMDCKQRSSTVSKKAPAVCKKASPDPKGWFWWMFPGPHNLGQKPE